MGKKIETDSALPLWRASRHAAGRQQFKIPIARPLLFHIFASYFNRQWHLQPNTAPLK
jgi:hypothetical protein